MYPYQPPNSYNQNPYQPSNTLYPSNNAPMGGYGTNNYNPVQGNQGYPQANNYNPAPNGMQASQVAQQSLYGSIPGQQYYTPSMSPSPYQTASNVAYNSMPGPSPTASFNGNWYANYYHQINNNEMNELRNWFGMVDRDRSGTISARELKDLTFGGRPLGYDTSVKLIKIFDRDRNLCIDFVEYATLHKFITTMQQIFSQCDINRSGTLDSAEILSALNMGGFQLSMQGAKAVFHKHNKTNTGVAFIDFLDIAADVAILRTHFEKRDVPKRGVISISFDDLIGMAGDV